MTTPFSVLIIGGGIAGPALAYWLSRLGPSLRITLIERSPDIRASGQQVDLRAQGVPMMHRMGISSAVQSVLVREVGTQLVDRQGRAKAFFPAGNTGDGRQSFTSEYEVMRGDLVRILYDLTKNKDNVEHRFGTTVEALEHIDGEKVTARFRDGKTEKFDLVVGADGTGSRTRAMMRGPGAPDPRVNLGGYIGYYSVASQPHDSDRGTFCHLAGGLPRAIGTRKDCAPLTRVYMITKGAVGEPGYAALDAAYRANDLAALRKAWADLYDQDDWECPRFVDALRHSPEAADFYCTPFEEVRLEKGGWSRGRVVLIGDAAHNQTAGGFGTTWGLIGAYVLAGELATRLSQVKKNGSGLSTGEAIRQATKAYEDTFRPVATANHGGTTTVGASLMFPTSSLGIWALQMFAKTAAWLRLDQAVGWKEATAKWELPTYPELEGAAEGQN